MCHKTPLVVVSQSPYTEIYTKPPKIRYKLNQPWDQLTQSQAKKPDFSQQNPHKITIFSSIPIEHSPFDLVWLSTDPMQQVLDLPKFHQYPGSGRLVGAHHAANPPQILVAFGVATCPSLRKHRVFTCLMRSDDVSLVVILRFCSNGNGMLAFSRVRTYDNNITHTFGDEYLKMKLLSRWASY